MDMVVLVSNINIGGKETTSFILNITNTVPSKVSDLPGTSTYTGVFFDHTIDVAPYFSDIEVTAGSQS